MSNTIRIKRRSSAGAAGAPSTLKNAELAFNEADNTLYYGKGADGGGNAITIDPIAGSGAFVTLGTNQTIAGVKTFSSGIVGNISTAATLQTGRNISLSSDITGTALFDGSQDISITATLANSGVTAGSYGNTTNSITANVDAKGRITSVSNQPIAFPVTSVNSLTGTVNLTTSNINEGTNLYYTDARVRLNRLDQLAAPTTSLSLNSQKIISLADPTQAQDAATKAYVDTVTAGAGNAPFESVRAISLSNITLSGTQTVDSISLIAGDRILVAGQSDPIQNGIYIVAAGAWSRSSDADSSIEVRPGKQVFVNEGTNYGDSVWAVINNTAPTIGTDAINFTQMSSLGQIIAGSGLTKSGNTIDVVAGTGISVAGDSVSLSGQALSLHNLSTNGLITLTSSGNVTSRTISSSGTGLSIANGDGVAGNPTISLADALSSIGGLTPASDRIPYYTGTNTAALATITSFARSILDDTDAATARGTLGLGTISTQDFNNVGITGGTIDSVTITNSTLDGGTF